MVKRVEFEVLDSSSNAIVARSPDRNFPGMLLQGDTLRILLDDVVELSELLRRGDCESAASISRGIEEQIGDLLIHYESTLKIHGVALPYTESVGEKK